MPYYRSTHDLVMKLGAVPAGVSGVPGVTVGGAGVQVTEASDRGAVCECRVVSLL